MNSLAFKCSPAKCRKRHSQGIVVFCQEVLCHSELDAFPFQRFVKDDLAGRRRSFRKFAKHLFECLPVVLSGAFTDDLASILHRKNEFGRLKHFLAVLRCQTLFHFVEENCRIFAVRLGEFSEDRHFEIELYPKSDPAIRVGNRNLSHRLLHFFGGTPRLTKTTHYSRVVAKSEINCPLRRLIVRHKRRHCAETTPCVMMKCAR